MQEQTIHQERIKRSSGKFKCAPPSPQFKLCRNNDAEFVCHECGVPLCAECAKQMKDRAFYRFESGTIRIATAIAVLILLPVVTGVLSKYIAILGIAGGLLSAIILFPAILSSLELLRRTEHDETGKLVSRFRIVRREYDIAVHCRRCAKQHGGESKVDMGFAAFGIIFLLLGFYGMVQGAITTTSINGSIILASLGLALLLAKNLLADLSVYYIPKLLRLS